VLIWEWRRFVGKIEIWLVVVYMSNKFISHPIPSLFVGNPQKRVFMDYVGTVILNYGKLIKLISVANLLVSSLFISSEARVRFI